MNVSVCGAIWMWVGSQVEVQPKSLVEKLRIIADITQTRLPRELVKTFLEDNNENPSDCTHALLPYARSVC